MTITEPGTYITRDGREVTILEVRENGAVGRYWDAVLGSKRTKALLVFVVVVCFQLAGAILVRADGFQVIESLSQNDWRRIWVAENVRPPHFPKYLKSAGAKHQFFAGLWAQGLEIKDRIQSRFGTCCDNIGTTANDWGFKLRENWFSVYEICHADDDTKLYFGDDIPSWRLAAVHYIKAAECPHLANIIAPADTSQIGFDLFLANIPLNFIRVSSEDQTFAGLSDGSGDVVDAKSGQEGLPYSQYEQCLGPKRHILLGTQILIGALLLAIGLYLVGKAFGEFGPVGVDAGAGYFVGGGTAITLGGCLVSGIAFLQICVAIQN